MEFKLPCICDWISSLSLSSATLTSDHLETEYYAAYGGLIIKKCKYADVNPVIIPDTLNGDPVTAIGEQAFKKCTAADITLPDSIGYIQTCAFARCQALRELHVPDNAWIGWGAFTDSTALTVYYNGETYTYTDDDKTERNWFTAGINYNT